MQASKLNLSWYINMKCRWLVMHQILSRSIHVWERKISASTDMKLFLDVYLGYSKKILPWRFNSMRQTVFISKVISQLGNQKFRSIEISRSIVNFFFVSFYININSKDDKKSTFWPKISYYYWTVEYFSHFYFWPLVKITNVRK